MRPVDNRHGGLRLAMLTGMKTFIDPLAQERRALETYYDDPLEPGDAVLLLDNATCLEITGLADDWCDVTRDNLLNVLTTSAKRVVVAVARPGYELAPRDYQLWRDLHTGLRDSGIDLLPLRALPAA